MNLKADSIRPGRCGLLHARRDSERWAANVRFPNGAIERADEFVIASYRVDRRSSFEREVKYLLDRAYRWSDDGTKLIPGN